MPRWAGDTSGPALAIQEELESRGVQAEVIDMLDYLPSPFPEILSLGLLLHDHARALVVATVLLLERSRAVGLHTRQLVDAELAIQPAAVVCRRPGLHAHCFDAFYGGGIVHRLAQKPWVEAVRVFSRHRLHLPPLLETRRA